MTPMDSLSDGASVTGTGSLLKLYPPLLILTRLPTWEAIEAAVLAYLTYCNYRPLPLFLPDILLSTLKERSHELILAILAVAGRFVTSPGVPSIYPTDRIEDYGQSARSLVMQHIANGLVELSTIQSLCILSLLEFNNCNTHLASTYSSLAMELALSAGLSAEYPGNWQSNTLEERRRCYWSVVLLKYLYGSASGFFTFIQDDKTPKPLQSPVSPIETTSQMTDTSLEQPGGSNNPDEGTDLGIFTYAIQLSEIWRKALRYGHRRGKRAGVLPPWSPQSEYAQILAHLTDFETKFAYKYRFRPAKIADHNPEQLRQHADFWAAWFTVQMLYHSILCLLNHPLLMSLTLRNVKMTLVPEVFLQHTAYLTATHTDWIIHLLDVSKQKNFRLHDPSLAHMAAVTATIYLQQSYAEDPAVQSRKQEQYQKCLSFIQDLGDHWPFVKYLAQKLEAFERVVSASFRDSAPPTTSGSRVLIDLSLFWEIIEATSIDGLPKTAESYFGSSLTMYRQPSHSAEVLRSRLLPEPTHINDTGATHGQASFQDLGDSTMQLANSEFVSSLDNDAAILAQSFFAQGDDFVGNMDDWWFQANTG
ncbi:hypothetical protein EDD36DRAFT_151370 [Exophiala viscosa]|uniref:Xylanolytic transcriptional activator regulatory domain-containing protein n=1 Tax=Exophiala viscosa TaxID=2486360 RepID=A0AAN6IGS8_9EURO|nr:hypothetical protein EDD36DRAFT_151370 [Exophiala viscosa]